MSISIISKTRLAKDVKFTEAMVVILLEGGRELSVPLEWFPRLRDAERSQFGY